MAVTRITSRVDHATDEALDAVSEACRDLIWLARDIGNGEHECGVHHVDFHIGQLDEAVGAVVKLCEAALGRRMVRPTLSALQAALTARMVENAGAELVDAEPRRKPDLKLVRFDDQGRKL